jgi:hypothetical protein
MKKLILLVVLSLSWCTAFSQEQAKTITQDNNQILNEEIRKLRTERIDTNRVICFYIAGDLAIGTNLSARVSVPFDGEITKAVAYIATAPTGASVIFDINKNGTSIWATTTGNRVTVAATANTGTQTSFDTILVSKDDYFTIDVDQIGSTLPGTSATVELYVKERIK